MSFDEPPFASHEDRPVGGEGAGPGARRSRWAIAVLAGVAVLVVTGVAAVVFGHLGGGGTPVGSPGSSSAAHPTGSKRYFACAGIMQPGAAPDMDYCARMAEDAMRRTELTEADKARLAADQKKAEQALSWPGFCADMYRPGYPSGRGLPQCDGLPKRDSMDGSGYGSASGDRRPDSMDARAIRISLDRAGFPGSVVRIAAGTDPAPRGSILFGVPVKDACLVGFMYSLRGGGSYGLAGRLPDGRCLAE
jgi:hypothetical protein